MTTKYETLERAEKASSLLRNLVIIIGALVSVAFFVADIIDTGVTVKVSEMSITGYRFLVTDRDAFSSLLTKVGQENDSRELLQSYQSGVGRLDSITKVLIRNESDDSVSLAIRMKHYKRTLIDPVDVEKGEFMRSSFVLGELSPTCPLNEDQLVLGKDGIISPDELADLEIKQFPPGCAIDMQFAHARSAEIVLNVLQDGKSIDFDHGQLIFGPVGRYAYLAVDDPPWSYIIYIVAPLVLFVLATLWLTQALWRPRSPGHADEKSLPANKSNTAPNTGPEADA